jgi:hypothetical protein
MILATAVIVALTDCCILDTALIAATSVLCIRDLPACALFTYAVREKYIRDNPFKGILIEVTPKEPKRISFADEKTVFSYIYVSDRDLFYQLVFLRLTGVRATDACLLPSEPMIDGSVMTLYNNKGKRYDIIPVTNALRIVLDRTTRHGAYMFKYRHKSTLYHYLQNACNECGVAPFGIHQLKKNYAHDVALCEPDERTYDALLHHSPSTNKTGVKHYSGKIHRLMLETLQKAHSKWTEFLRELGTK